MTAPPKTIEELIEEGQPLVYSLASKISRRIPIRIELDDLVSYGEIGLAEAARDFDPNQGVRFTTFAYYRVRGAIYDGLSKMSWTSRARYKRLRYEQMANEVMLQASAESAQADPKSSNVETESQWFRNLTDRLAIVYFGSGGEEGKGIRDSTIEDPRASAASSIVAKREIVEKLSHVLADLPSVEQRLVRAVYFEGATLQDAARSLGISKSWASRLHAKALDQLARSLKRLGASE